MLPPLAALAGDWLFGPSAALWGFVGGFVLGLAAAVATLWIFTRLKSD